MTDYERFGENQETESRGGGIGLALAFLFIGVGAGAIAALLLAPQSGKKTRRTLRRKYEDAREVFDDLKGQAGDAFERGSDWVDNAKEKVAPIARKIRR
jgi:gas vesicle protein